MRAPIDDVVEATQAWLRKLPLRVRRTRSEHGNLKGDACSAGEYHHQVEGMEFAWRKETETG